jgi:DNA-binding transcriptional MerR regulator
MTVVNNMLLIRRINELHRKREALIERQDRMRSVLPDWTIEPLKMAGMSAREIESLMSETSMAEQKSGLEQIERDVERVDQQIEEAENQLISSPHKSLNAVEAVLRLAVDRLRRQVSTDPNDVFYDYGEARVIFMLGNVLDDLHAYMREGQRAAS